MSTLYKIKLQNFEGPLDLLLFFVRKDELNIYDIPLARITKSYLEYLQLMQDLNLDIASEFILMAATLMRIKVKMMLPKDPVAEEEEEMMDPREELSRRLIEYRQFKEASKSLSELDAYWRQVYRRSYFNFDLIPQNEEEVIGLKDISFFDLLAAYKKALEKKPIPVFHNVERLNVTVEDQQKYIMDFFRDRNCYLFTELCDDMAKIEIVVTFLALLDLVKRAEIAIKQASIFDDIWIYKASEFKDEGIPEAERADRDIPILTDPIETTQDLIETESGSETTEFLINEEPVNSEVIITGNLSGVVSTSTEIEVEFIETESKTVAVNEENENSAEAFHSPVDIELTKTESEPISSDAQDETVPVGEEKGLLTELQREVIYDQMTENLKREEISEDFVNTSPVPAKTADVQDIDAAGSSDTVKEGIDRTEETAIQENAGKEKVLDAVIDGERKLTFVEKQSADIVEMQPVREVQAGHALRANPETERLQTEVFTEAPPIEKEKIPEEKVSRWKNFFHKIVSIVRKIFSK